MRHELSSASLTWVNLQSPEAEELAAFIREADLAVTDAEFLAQAYHRPAITCRPHYVLLLIQVPVFDRTLRLTEGVPLFLVITPERLMTLHYKPLVVLDKIRHDLTASEEQREEYLSGGAASAGIDIVAMLYDSAFHKLERLSKHIDIAEDAVFRGNERKMVEEISLLTRDVMDFRKVMRPQKHLFVALPNHPLLPSELSYAWARLHNQLLRMWDMLESMFESVRELSSTNFTLLQYKENALLRVLTIYSIIAVPAFILVAPLNLPELQFASPPFYGFIGLVVLFTLLLVFIFLRSRHGRG